MTRGPMLAWTWLRRPVADVKKTCDDHEQIINAIRQGDGATARTLIIAHIRRGRDEAIKGFELQRLQPTRPSYTRARRATEQGMNEG